VRLRLLDLAGGVYPLKEAGMLRREEIEAMLVRMTLFISFTPMGRARVWRRTSSFE
jgi:hypothetical protein